MKKIVIIGAGGFGREIKNLIDDINKKEEIYEVIGFYDDERQKGEHINGIPIIGELQDLNNTKESICVVLGIGVPAVKLKIAKSLNNPLLEFPVLIHPSVLIGNDDVVVEKGTIITAGNIITCNIKIEEFVTLNLMCTVGHDTIIRSFSSFMPNVNISGEVIIGNNVYVGTGAKIINQTEIGNNTIVGAGAVVSKSLPPDCTAVGIPAKPIKFHNSL